MITFVKCRSVIALDDIINMYICIEFELHSQVSDLTDSSSLPNPTSMSPHLYLRLLALRNHSNYINASIYRTIKKKHRYISPDLQIPSLALSDQDSSTCKQWEYPTMENEITKTYRYWVKLRNPFSSTAARVKCASPCVYLQTSTRDLPNLHYWTT